MYTADGCSIYRDGTLIASTADCDTGLVESFDYAANIARALNRDAALGEVREAAMKESEDWPRPGIFEAGARYVLEALDAAEHRCERVVYKADGMRFPRPKQCKRDGVNFEDGKLWCTQHTPSIKKAKEDKEHKQYMEQRRRDNERMVHNNAAIAACADIPNPAGIPGAVEFIHIIANFGANGSKAVQAWVDAASKALRAMGLEP